MKIDIKQICDDLITVQMFILKKDLWQEYETYKQTKDKDRKSIEEFLAQKKGANND